MNFSSSPVAEKPIWHSMCCCSAYCFYIISFHLNVCSCCCSAYCFYIISLSSQRVFASSAAAAVAFCFVLRLWLLTFLSHLQKRRHAVDKRTRTAIQISAGRLFVQQTDACSFNNQQRDATRAAPRSKRRSEGTPVHCKECEEVWQQLSFFFEADNGNLTMTRRKTFFFPPCIAY